MIVLLDSGPRGFVTNPKKTPKNVDCALWLERLLLHGVRVIVPEIADYEVRRELIRANKIKGLARLDAIGTSLEYLPISTGAIRLAAEIWANARLKGLPTASDAALDSDVILAAQALHLSLTDTLVATTNVAHLQRFVHAKNWDEIVSA